MRQSGRLVDALFAGPLLAEFSAAARAGGSGTMRGWLARSDRWVWMTCVSVLWGTAVAWLTAIGLTVWRRRLWVAHASTVPVTLATSIGATVCVGGACAVTSSIMA
ncbi:MAG: hypothetical protein M0Z36_06740, partial [Thermaerobacter sp.]|nr:hypothetical protein [Thermaerobacter sp.]